MSVPRMLLMVLGAAIWVVGALQFLDRSFVAGGLLVLAGGACLAGAARVGWERVVEAVFFWLALLAGPR